METRDGNPGGKDALGARRNGNPKVQKGHFSALTWANHMATLFESHFLFTFRTLRINNLRQLTMTPDTDRLIDMNQEDE